MKAPSVVRACSELDAGQAQARETMPHSSSDPARSQQQTFGGACAGQCGRGPNAVLLPDALIAYGVNRKTSLWLVLTRIWGLDAIPKSAFDAVMVRALLRGLLSSLMSVVVHAHRCACALVLSGAVSAHMHCCARAQKLHLFMHEPIDWVPCFRFFLLAYTILSEPICS